MFLYRQKYIFFSNYDKYVVNNYFPSLHLREMEMQYRSEVKKFGLEVKRLRRLAKLTQQQLAYKCDMDIRTVQRIERGDSGVGLYILFAIAEAFNLTPSQLLQGVTHKHK
jgi:DNA-binding XRE family transcriptional regulator